VRRSDNLGQRPCPRPLGIGEILSTAFQFYELLRVEHRALVSRS
jgi:hypothetical protein